MLKQQISFPLGNVFYVPGMILYTIIAHWYVHDIINNGLGCPN